MGWVDKITGGNGRRREEAAATQAAKTAEQSARDQAMALQANAAQAAAQNASLSARAAMEAKVTADMNKPIDTAEVVLDAQEETATTQRKRKAAYGKGAYSTGVKV